VQVLHLFQAPITQLHFPILHVLVLTIGPHCLACFPTGWTWIVLVRFCVPTSHGSLQELHALQGLCLQCTAVGARVGGRVDGLVGLRVGGRVDGRVGVREGTRVGILVGGAVGVVVLGTIVGFGVGLRLGAQVTGRTGTGVWPCRLRGDGV
jgi:hypothetical protein